MLEKQLTKEKLELEVGELLVASDILSERDLGEAIRAAAFNQLPLGSILIMAGFCSESEFQAALNAQALIRDSLAPVDLAVKALNQISTQAISFEDALRELGWVPNEDKESNKLGELLLAADILPAEKIDAAMQTCKKTGLPLGRLLISLGLISEELLATALNAQILIRAGRVNRAQAIRGLKSGFNRLTKLGMTANIHGFYRGPYRPTIRLAELLVLAELISEEDALNALEESLKQEKSVGRVLVEKKIVSLKLLNLALTLQEMVTNETIMAKQAAIVLSALKTTNQSLEDILAFLEIPDAEVKTSARFHDLLRVAGLIQASDLADLQIDPKAKASSGDAFRTARLLTDQGLLDKRTFLGSLRCYYLMLNGWLSMQQGIIALDFFCRKNGSFDEALAELKWTIRTHRQEEE
jgi:hypothetical protein